MNLERRYFGPPGSGKTHKIIHEILPDCIDKYGTAGIIVVSYTRTAAAEIINRMGGKIQTFNTASTFDLGIDEIPGSKIKAGTLHSLCFHALKSPQIASGKEVMEQFCKEYLSGRILLSNDRLESIAFLRNKLVSPETIRPGPLKTLWRVWTEFKTRHNYCDFTDLIEKCLEMPIAPGNPLCIIVDEAQDMTPLQIKLLRHWNKHLKALYLVGDDDQSIFGFIGASATEMIRKDLPDTEIHTTVLTTSRRLPEKIHQYSKKYIEKITKREEKNFTHNGNIGYIQNIGTTIDHNKTLNQIIDEAKTKSVMIISSCDYMLNGIIDKMKQFGIPFSNQYKMDDNRWNPVDLKTYSIIKAVQNTRDAGDVYLWLKYIKKELLQRKVTNLNDLEKEAFYRPYLKEYLIDFAFDQFEDLDPNDRLTWFMNVIEPKYVKKFEYAEKVINGEYKDLKNITIGTIHSVKGREAQVVFICPDKSPAMIKESQYDKSEIIRLFYVAMTRASEKLYFCKPSKDGIKFKV